MVCGRFCCVNQITLAVMISGWSHVIHAIYKPWGAASPTYKIQHLSLFTTTFVFVMGLLLKVNGVAQQTTGFRVRCCAGSGVVWWDDLQLIFFKFGEGGTSYAVWIYPRACALDTVCHHGRPSRVLRSHMDPGDVLGRREDDSTKARRPSWSSRFQSKFECRVVLRRVWKTIDSDVTARST